MSEPVTRISESILGLVYPTLPHSHAEITMGIQREYHFHMSEPVTRISESSPGLVFLTLPHSHAVYENMI